MLPLLLLLPLLLFFQLLPFTELWGDLHPLERQAGVVTPSGPPASTRAAAAAPGEAGYEAAAESSGSMRLPPLQVMGVSHAVLTEPAEATSCLCRAEKSRGAASVLSNFVLRFLSAYFGSATQQREGGQQLRAYPNGGETLSAERPTEEDRRALAAHLGPEPLLAGKLMLQTLSTEAFTAIARIATACTYTLPPDDCSGRSCSSCTTCGSAQTASGSSRAHTGFGVMTCMQMDIATTPWNGYCCRRQLRDCSAPCPLLLYPRCCCSRR